MVFPFRSGLWEECTLVRQPFDLFHLENSRASIGQFYNHRGDRDYAEMWARVARDVLL